MYYFAVGTALRCMTKQGGVFVIFRIISVPPLIAAKFVHFSTYVYKMTSLPKFTSLHIDYKSNSSYLCELGKKYDTDKSSQRSNVSNSRYCHPYTLFYNSLFKHKCGNILDIAEIGILDGSSLRMWQDYFPRSNIYGFEYEDRYIQKFKESFNNDRVTLTKIDVTKADSINASFRSTHKLYDVIIDDSTHQFQDQIRIIENTYQYLKPGGVLIIEDIFKRYNENDFITSLAPILDNFQDYYFISLDHVNRNSTGWDNDKLVVLVRNGGEPIFKITNKIAKHVTFHFNKDKIRFINTILKESNKYNYATDIYIHTNDKAVTASLFEPYANGTLNIIHHDMTGQDPFTLTWKCRELMAKQKDEYDVFMYVEDDILVPVAALDYWIEGHERLVANGYNLGFVRIETSDNEEYMTDVNSVLKTKLELDGISYYVNNVNPYCAFWIYDKQEFNKFVSSKYWDAKNVPNYQTREKSGIGLHGFGTTWYKATVIPVQKMQLTDSCKIVHLTNNYAKRHPIFGILKFKDALDIGSSLESSYKIKSAAPSDINEHLPTLRKLAEECTHITEAGVRSVVSSYAFATALKGKAGHTLVQVDLVKSPNVTKFQAECKAEGVNTLFYEESDLTCPLADTDLFFIDTWHIYGHLKRELARWHSHAKNYIVMHDTTVDEWLGETVRVGWNAAEQSKQTGIPVDEITKGLWPAIDEFLKEHPEWLLEKRYTNNNGLTILKRRSVENPWNPVASIRPPVLVEKHKYLQAIIDFLSSAESPERTLPIQLHYEIVNHPVIFYNVEQLPRADILTNVMKTVTNPLVKEVWDYSAENCKILAAKGVVARHVPLVSPATYVQQIKDLRKDLIYDVGFCGFVRTDAVCRRQVILDKLRDAGISVHFVNKFGLERDKELAKCRVILNVHFAEDYKIFEQVRCDVWLRAGVPVISETSLDDDPRCINVPYNSIVDTTVNMLKALRPRQPANDSLVIGVVYTKGSDIGKALSGLLAQTLDKTRTHIVLASAEEVHEFATFDQSRYASVTRYVGNYAQEHIVGKALELGAHACFIESRHSLEPHTVQTLLDSKEKGVIAPMLTSQTRYSNYHTKVDAYGYCLDDPMYDDLLYKRVKGQIAVPVVNGTYFVHHKFLSQISYTDGTKRDSYVVMSDGLRKKGIPQYLDNRQHYGTIV
jgi:SAM-dependent methyltransferase